MNVALVLPKSIIREILYLDQYLNSLGTIESEKWRVILQMNYKLNIKVEETNDKKTDAEN